MAMLETVVEAIAAPIFEGLWKLGGGAIADIKKTYSKVDAVNQLRAASQRYEAKYRKRHGQMKVMPALMKKARSLESIYTAVKLLDDASRRYLNSQQDLEEAFRQAGRRSFQLGVDERLDGLAVARQEQYLMVLGGPGIGKSTFLKKLGFEALKSGGTHIPVLIELKDLVEEEIDLLGAIATEFDLCGFPAAANFTATALKQGKLLILLDGLDEVPKQNFNRVAERIEDFVDRYDPNRFVTSCRIAAYRSSFQRFTDVTIAEFDDEQIEQFIHNWFDSDLDQQQQTAQKYWQLLSQPEHQATKELAQTPLLLTFLCLIYDRKQTLPQKRSHLYGAALDILLTEWAAQKRLERDPIYEGFHADLEKALLAQIACDSFEQDRLFFSKAEVTCTIVEFLADNLGAPPHLDGAAVLRAIEVQQGILVERAPNTYSFSHLTLQEYLTAYPLVREGRVEHAIADHVLDDRWREVFLLMAGLPLAQAEKLCLSLEKAALEQIANSSKVKHLIQWADSITDTQHKSLSNRAAAIFIARIRAKSIDGSQVRTITQAITIALIIARASALAFDALVLASDLNSALDSARTIKIIPSSLKFALALKFARSFDRYSLRSFIEMQVFSTENLSQLPAQLLRLKQSCPDKAAPAQDWRQWADELEAVWLDSFNLTQDMVTLSKEEAEALANYLYIIELIVRCKDAAVLFKKKDWEALESRLLTLAGS